MFRFNEKNNALAATGITPRGQSFRPTKVLLIAHILRLPYRVLICLRACGCEVTVLGNRASLSLRLSRHCPDFILAESEFDGTASAAMAEEIDSHATALGADVVVPGDPYATRSLVALKSELRAPCFPLPDLATYVTIYDKWQFTQLCQQLQILCPPTQLLPDRDAVTAAVANGLSLPAICKPLDAEASRGVLKLSAADAAAQIEQIQYAPVLVQHFIEGEDICASVYCENGEIKAFIAYRFRHQIYHTFHHDGIFEAVSRIMRHFGTDGVYNFDMRLAPDRQVFFLECNPRFFFKMDLSMWAGMNFVIPGVNCRHQMPARVPDGHRVLLPKALGLALLTRPWTVSARDWRVLASMISDPVPFVRQEMNWNWSDPPADLPISSLSNEDEGAPPPEQPPSLAVAV